MTKQRSEAFTCHVFLIPSLPLRLSALWPFFMFGDRLLPSSAEEEVAESNAGGPAGRRGGGGGRPAVVTLEEITVEPFRIVYEAVGTVEALARVTVQTAVAGTVTRIGFTPGAEVREDDALLMLDARQQELALSSASATLEEAEETLARTEQLARSGSISATTLQDAQTAVSLAQIAVEQAEFDLGRRTVTAPLSGVIGLTDFTQGGYLNAGTEIATISQAEQVNIAFSLPERATAVLELGRMVRVTLPSRPGQSFSAQVSAIATEIAPVTRQIAVEAVMDNAEAGLTHGMIASVQMAVDQPPHAIVPALSLSWSRDEPSVYVSREGVAEQVPVTLRHRVNDQIWVEADLASGDQVVVEGVQKLRPGSPVMIAGQGRPRGGDGRLQGGNANRQGG